MSHSHNMDMNMGTATTATTAAMASSTSAMSGMSGHDHGGMDMGGSCKISMLWNWNTIDACFVSRSWHITSRGMFAGSCIGVILLVILLEFLRRAGKEYDRYLVAQHTRSVGSSDSLSSSSSTAAVADATKGPNSSDRAAACNPVVSQPFRPNVMQQAIRALLHMLQFAVAYFVMLLAMYYNGYIIICIFIGAYLGYFIFGWETLNAKVNGRMQEEVTVCCG